VNFQHIEKYFYPNHKILWLCLQASDMHLFRSGGQYGGEAVQPGLIRGRKTGKKYRLCGPKFQPVREVIQSLKLYYYKPIQMRTILNYMPLSK
jgi:hypothetical protein